MYFRVELSNLIFDAKTEMYCIFIGFNTHTSGDGYAPSRFASLKYSSLSGSLTGHTFRHPKRYMFPSTCKASIDSFKAEI